MTREEKIKKRLEVIDNVDVPDKCINNKLAYKLGRKYVASKGDPIYGGGLTLDVIKRSEKTWVLIYLMGIFDEISYEKKEEIETRKRLSE